MSETVDGILRLLETSSAALRALCAQAGIIAQIAEQIAGSLSSDGTLFLCGNGGSAAECQHAAAELTGRFQLERRGLRAIALTTDTSALTAIGNDYGFDRVFARQLDALARSGDVLMGLSTSGTSRNVLAAFDTAKRKGVVTIALTGPEGGPVADGADLSLRAPGQTTAVVQECHLAALHIICGIVERKLA